MLFLRGRDHLSLMLVAFYCRVWWGLLSPARVSQIPPSGCGHCGYLMPKNLMALISGYLCWTCAHFLSPSWRSLWFKSPHRHHLPSWFNSLDCIQFVWIRHCSLALADSGALVWGRVGLSFLVLSSQGLSDSFSFQTPLFYQPPVSKFLSQGKLPLNLLWESLSNFRSWVTDNWYYSSSMINSFFPSQWMALFIPLIHLLKEFSHASQARRIWRWKTQSWTHNLFIGKRNRKKPPNLIHDM